VAPTSALSGGSRMGRVGSIFREIRETCPSCAMLTDAWGEEKKGALARTSFRLISTTALKHEGRRLKTKEKRWV